MPRKFKSHEWRSARTGPDEETRAVAQQRPIAIQKHDMRQERLVRLMKGEPSDGANLVKVEKRKTKKWNSILTETRDMGKKESVLPTRTPPRRLFFVGGGGAYVWMEGEAWVRFKASFADIQHGLYEPILRLFHSSSQDSSGSTCLVFRSGLQPWSEQIVFPFLPFFSFSVVPIGVLPPVRLHGKTTRLFFRPTFGSLDPQRCEIETIVYNKQIETSLCRWNA